MAEPSRGARAIVLGRSGRAGFALKVALGLLGLALAGCAGHASRTAEARSALDAKNPELALSLLNEELDVENAAALPDDLSGDNTLLILDRSMVLQQLAKYQLSSRDLEIADKRIEVLDFSRGAVDELGKYLYSDDAGPYKAPPYEKLMINTMNMVNYLARGDLGGARIEARRLAVMQKFISESESPAEAALGPGSYLAGFTFEKSMRYDEALRFYDEALEHGDYQSLASPVRRLLSKSGYKSPRLRRLVEAGSSSPTAEEGAQDGETAEEADGTAESGEILVIVSFGRVPAKVAERVPIGLALTYASGALSPNQVSRANYLAAQGLVTWVNYPELGKPRGQYDRPGFAIDGEWQRLEGALAVDKLAHTAWDSTKGTIIAAAITRLLARVAAGEVVRQVSGEGIEGALLSLVTQATLTAADTPDTRSWATLPARMALGRVRVAPGQHWVHLEARGKAKRQRVTVKPGGWAVVALTVLG